MEQGNVVLGERVNCPVSGTRLFDLISTEVELNIKCPICKNIIHVVGNKVRINKENI